MDEGELEEVGSKIDGSVRTASERPNGSINEKKTAIDRATEQTNCFTMPMTKMNDDLLLGVESTFCRVRGVSGRVNICARKFFPVGAET